MILTTEPRAEIKAGDEIRVTVICTTNARVLSVEGEGDGVCLSIEPCESVHTATWCVKSGGWVAF